MKEGDIIKTYYAGYFILDKIEKRFKTEADEKYNYLKDLEVGEEYSPLFHFTQIYDENLNKRTSSRACDAQFCEPAGVAILEEILKLEAKIIKLKEFYNEIRNQGK